MSGFNPENIPDLLGPAGPLAAGVPDYEDRPYQRELALEVARLMEDGGCLAAEAPTGIGKSLAYMLPAAGWASAGGGPVVISTHTKALQRQLVELEAPRLRQAISGDLKVKVLKGRANYLCRRRYEAALRDAKDKNRIGLLQRIEPWVETTTTGDLAECGEKDPEAQRFLARHVASDPWFCSGPECSAQNGCFFKKARLEAGAADLLVVNHALLAVHLFGERHILPSFAALIVDEAHAFLRVGLEQLTVSVGPARLAMLLERAPSAAGVVPRALREGRGASLLAALQDHVSRVEAEGRKYFGKSNGKSPSGETRLRYRDGEERRALCPLSPDPLVHSLRSARADLVSLRAWTEREGEESGEMEGFTASVERFDEETDAFLRDLDELLEPDSLDTSRVVWKEWEGNSFSLRASPLSLASHLAEGLRDGPQRLVFTSATLAAAKDFSYFARETGLEGRIHSIAYPSPFDFANQALAVAVRTGPDPREPGWARVTAETLDALLRDPARKTLALFTSYRDLEAVHAALRARGADERAPLLAQGTGGGAQDLLNRFRRSSRALLLGTASFWEGVDLPGDDLEVLVLTRLPFGVPTDPRYQARAEKLEQDGGNPFFDLYLPEAVLRFKQGFGRLIRRRSDRGIVAVLDPRLSVKNYGSRFTHALPLPVTMVPDGTALARAAADWWREHGNGGRHGRTPADDPVLAERSTEPVEEGETS